MSAAVQNEICDFVREVLAARTGEAISVALRPEVVHRNAPAVEELWDSPSHGYDSCGLSTRMSIKDDGWSDANSFCRTFKYAHALSVR